MNLPYNNIITELPAEEDYEFLGGSTTDKSIGGLALVETGQWDKFLPVFELQKNNLFDSYSCVSYARNNVLEALHIKKYGEEVNNSDRFTSVMTETVPRRGNSLIKGAKLARKTGNVLESEYPSIRPDMTEAEFYQKVPKEIKLLGLEWLEYYNLQYEWVNKLMLTKIDKKKAMKALKYSPLQTAIDANTKNPARFRGYNDSVIIYGYEEGKHWKVFGSYPQTTGDYPWDYPFYNPLRFDLTRIKIKKTPEVLPKEENDMKLLKIEEDPKIYLLDFSNRLHHIADEESYERIIDSDKDFTRVKVVSKEVLNEYPMGETLNMTGMSLIDVIKFYIRNNKIKIND
jgi:hypothetical protein